MPSRALLEVMRNVPPWAWLLVGGCLAILVVCSVISLVLPSEGLDRALVSTVLLGVGVMGVIAAEAWVLPMIAMDAHHLGVMDFIISHRLWHFAFQRLPRTRGPVCLLSWCVTAVLGALLIVGGLWYWLPTKKKDKFHLSGPVVKAAPRESNKSSDEVYNEKEKVIEVKDQPPTGEPETDDANGEKPTTLRCVVLGYVPDDENRLVSLVLGVEEGKDRYRYAGVVKRGIHRGNEEQLRNRLSRYIRLKPPIEGLQLQVQAVWVEPRVFCEVTQSGSGSAAVLPNPLFKALLLDPNEKKK